MTVGIASNPCSTLPSERRLSKIRIQDFKVYCKENFDIEGVFKQISDRRKRPQIKTRTVCWAIVNMVSLGIKSLLELDQLGRLSGMRRYIGTNRYMVSSDTTYDRVLKLMSVETIRKSMVKIYQKLQKKGLDEIKLESSRQVRIAGIDGSGFGKYEASVISMFGKTQIVLDVEPYSRKGKELPSSYAVIKRTRRSLGKSFCDVLIGDGLYRGSKFFKLCKESGFDGLVKTEETRLDVIKDALGLYKAKDDKSIERITAFDRNRLCEYSIEAVTDVRMAGLRDRLKIVHIKEYYPKPERHGDFFVITTKQDLTGNECRELAHRRWTIENKVFKELSQNIKSKSVHTHNENVLTALLLLWYIGFNLLNAFLFKHCIESFRQIFGYAKQTLGIIIAYMRFSLGLVDSG